MSRRRRKRGGAVTAPRPARQRAPAPPAVPRRGRPSADERPQPPWHPVPLVELCVLLGIVLLVLGAFDLSSDRGRVLLVCGMALGSLGGLDTALREHFAGFRSHTTLLAGAVAAVAIAVTYFATDDRFAALGAAIVVFSAGFWLFRRVFVQRTGGVAFRR